MRVTIVSKTEKQSGSIRLRFRLRDTGIDIYYKSRVIADINDMKKITIEGKKKPKVVFRNTKLLEDIETEMGLIHGAYKLMIENGIPISTENLEKIIIALEYGRKTKCAADFIIPSIIKPEPTLLEKLKTYIAEGVSLNVFGNARVKIYNVLYGILERYLTINRKKSLRASEFKTDEIKKFYRFISEEYLYVERYPAVYAGLKSSSVPKQERQQNTVSNYLKALQAAFKSFEGEHNPFADLPTKFKSAMLKAEYDEPICLNRSEFMQIYNSQVPAKYEETRDAFLLQCAFGCRISDFTKLSMRNVSVSADGIPYIHYLPQKTQRTNSRHEETETPIMLYALEIIKKRNFEFAILKNVSGHAGYNARIRELLEICGINRIVKEYDEVNNSFKEKPLYEAGCNKLCRKTHVNIMNEVQIDKYAAGLHSVGSQAVERYICNCRKQHFILMCAAFQQPIYKVDSELNIINE